MQRISKNLKNDEDDRDRSPDPGRRTQDVGGGGDFEAVTPTKWRPPTNLEEWRPQKAPDPRRGLALAYKAAFKAATSPPQRIALIHLHLVYQNLERERPTVLGIGGL